MLIIDGKKRAAEIMTDLVRRVDLLRSQGKMTQLNIIMVGNDPVSLNYIRQKELFAQKIGASCEVCSFDAETPIEQLESQIGELLQEKRGSWIVQLPIPNPLQQHEFALLDIIPTHADVDCLNAESYGKLFRGDSEWLPPTAAAIIDLLESYNIELSGKHVVIIGAGRLVGKPLWAALIDRGCTITTCTEKTKNIDEFTKIADIVISGVGKPHVISASSQIRENSVMIDAGLSWVDGKLRGDIDIDAIKDKASAYTPVPGGVGPVTVAKLFEQLVIRTEQN